jgi:hypothetical protein
VIPRTLNSVRPPDYRMSVTASSLGSLGGVTPGRCRGQLRIRASGRSLCGR